VAEISRSLPVQAQMTAKSGRGGPASQGIYHDEEREEAEQQGGGEQDGPC